MSSTPLQHHDCGLSNRSKVASFQLLGIFASLPRLHVWRSNFVHPTSPDALFQPAEDVLPVNGTFSITLAIGDVVTLTTEAGRHGAHTAPAKPAPFPIPYSDNFDKYDLESEAAYFSDMSGAFEIVDASRFGSSSRAMQQVPIFFHSSKIRLKYFTLSMHCPLFISSFSSCTNPAGDPSVANCLAAPQLCAPHYHRRCASGCCG